MTSGIFLRLCAEAAEEELALGKKEIAPLWRVVKDAGSLMEKFPDSPNLQAKRLKSEGFEIAKNRVRDFEKFLMEV